MVTKNKMVKKMLYSTILHKKGEKHEQGSFTIEASLLFPIIFLLLVFLIFVSIYLYQKVSLYYMASDAAEKVAFNWSNSHKDPITGELKSNEYDDLYWRLTSNNVMDIIANNQEPMNKSVYVLPSKNSPNEMNKLSLPMKKMAFIASTLPENLTGEIEYSHHLTSSSITVTLETPINLPLFVSRIFGERVSARASVDITDPVEFIRNIDILGNYAHSILGSRNLKDFFKRKKK